MTQKQYAALVKEISPKSPIGKDCLYAFVIGGLICTLGQGLCTLYRSFGLSPQDGATAASMTLVALSALLTGLSLYDDLANAKLFTIAGPVIVYGLTASVVYGFVYYLTGF